MLSASLLAALLAALPCPTPTRPTPQPDEKSWLVAPAGCWTTRGGPSGRTRATNTEPVRNGDLDLDFAIDLEAELVGEPLFDPSFVLVELRTSPDERRLVAFDANTGRTVAARDFDVEHTLAPSYVDGVVVVRAERRELLALRPTARGFVRTGSARSDGLAFGPLVGHDGSVFVAIGSELARYDGPALRLAWRAPLGEDDQQWLGALAVVGERAGGEQIVGTIGGARTGRATVAFARASDGRTLSVARSVAFDFSSNHRGDQPFLPAQYPGGAGVWHDGGGFAKQKDDVLRFVPIGYGGDLQPGPLGATHEAAVRAGKVFARFEGGDDGVCVALVDPLGPETDASIVLVGTKDHHANIVASTTRASWAQDVVLFGGRAWQPASGRVLWHEPELEGLDLYPIERGVLAVRSPTRLEIWREAHHDVDVRHESAAAPAEASAGLALLRDGTTARGTFAIDGTDLVDSAGKKPLRRPLADVWFACREDGHVVVASGARSIAVGLAALNTELARDEFKHYADAAQRSNDPEVVRVALEHAGELGEDGAELEETLAALLAKSKSISSKQKERALGFVAARETRTSALREAAARSLAPDSGTNTLHAAALHDLILHARSNAFARASIEALLPEGLALPANADLADWLDFAVAVAAHPVAIVPLRPENAPDLTPTEKRIGYLARGRKGVVGFESEHLLVVSSVDRPGAVARCVALGEHVCTLLEGWFEADGDAPTASRKLEIVLHATREEYLEESGAWNAGAEHALAWTAGHFDPSIGVSRLYLPSGGEGWSDAARTLLHELTHHWLHSSCPRIEPGRMIPAGARGFWIVEGFASLVENHVVDVLRGVVAPIDPRSPRLDVVANAAGATLIPWDGLVALPQAALVGLSAIPEQPIPLTWHLGLIAPTNGIGLFYAQSAALTSFLFHGDGGRLRGKLLDYLVAYYSGSKMDLDFAEHFGATAAELAGQVEAHAQSAVRAR